LFHTFLSTGKMFCLLHSKNVGNQIPKSPEIVEIVESIKETLFSMTKI